jgi:hypothetical protein
MEYGKHIAQARGPRVRLSRASLWAFARTAVHQEEKIATEAAGIISGKNNSRHYCRILGFRTKKSAH